MNGTSDAVARVRASAQRDAILVSIAPEDLRAVLARIDIVEFENATLRRQCELGRELSNLARKVGLALSVTKANGPTGAAMFKLCIDYDAARGGKE